MRPVVDPPRASLSPSRARRRWRRPSRRRADRGTPTSCADDSADRRSRRRSRARSLRPPDASPWRSARGVRAPLIRAVTVVRPFARATSRTRRTGRRSRLRRIQPSPPTRYCRDMLGPLETEASSESRQWARARVTADVDLVHCPGHTPGEHGGRRLHRPESRRHVLGDAMAHPAQIHEPDWRLRLRSSTKRDARRSRRQLVEQLDKARSWSCGAGHFGLGRTRRSTTEHPRWLAVPASP